MNSKFLALAFISFLFFSCSKDDTSDSAQYSKGVFVVKSGVFQSGTGTITYHNYQDTIENLFEKKTRDKCWATLHKV
ncbi:MAG: hypothetical protein IPO37_14895 [Saprospiraceae bacterium]|nr:hypothetical protein [Saprospiraceae bacterium]